MVERKSNFELMRIISIIFIIFSHIIIHGHLIENSVSSSIDFLLKVIQFIVIVHVNSFVLLSGYFQSKSSFKLSKLLKLLLEVLFYSVLCLVIGKVFFNYPVSITELIERILPLNVDNYWFIKTYLILYLFSDILNKYINSIDKKFYRYTLNILFIVFSVFPIISNGKLFQNGGYSLCSFIFLYLLGAYIRKYNVKNSYHFKDMNINKYRIMLIFIFFSMAGISVLLAEFGSRGIYFDGIIQKLSLSINHYVYGYSNPFIVIQSLVFFLFFETLNIKSKKINYIASTVFGIYLFHDDPIIRKHIYKILGLDTPFINTYNIFIGIFISCVILFIVGLMIEIFRKYLFKILNKIFNKYIEKFRLFIESLNLKLNW